MWLRGCAFLIPAMLACAPACGTPTSLNVIPTADVLPNGQANITVQLLGGPLRGGYQFANQLQTELGLGDVIEFGVDPSLGPNTGNAWNAKYRIYDETRRRPAVAVGQFVDLFGTGNPPYIVGFKSIGSSRLHFGATAIEGSTRALAGYDFWHGRPLTLQADYVSGPGAYASFGFVYNLNNGLSLNVAQLIGNSSYAPNAYLVTLGWTGQVFGASASKHVSDEESTGRHKMILLAHRGESYIAPENTLAAFNLAWKNGAEAVELDCYLTHDNKIVVMHDAKTGRTAGIDLVLKDTDSAELRKLDVGKWKGEQFAGEKIPFLEEALATIPPRGRLLVEIKCGAEILPFLRDVLDKSGKRSQVTLISFSLDVVAQSKKMMPDVPHYYLRSPAKDPNTGQYQPYDPKLIQTVLDNHLDGLDLHYAMVTKEFADAIKAKGLALWTWTVNEPVEAKHQMELGADGLGTDRCAWLEEQIGTQ